MKIYQHRRNTRASLDATPLEYGVEIDLRSWGNNLVLEHEPFVQGEHFSNWMLRYQHSGLILNIKEEGLEVRLLEIMEHHHVSDFFFLDQSYPFMIKWLNAGLGAHIAARVSDYESLSSLTSLPATPGYIWCDSFTGSWGHLTATIEYASNINSRVILVSPELQSRKLEGELDMIKAVLYKYRHEQLGVCTKVPESWI